MTKLIVSRLNKNSITKLMLKAEIFEEQGLSPSFEIKTPPAVPLMSYSNINLKVEPGPPQYTTNGSNQYYFSKYTKLEATRKGYYRLRVLILTNISRGELEPEETVRLRSNSTNLSDLDAEEFTVLKSYKSSTGKRWVLDLEVPEALKPGQDTATVDSDNSYVREVTIKRERSNFIVTIPRDSVYNNLVNARKPATGTLQLGVKDVPIYAYKNWYKENTSKIPKLSMYNNEEIDETTPPEYSSGMRDAFLSANSYQKMFFTDKKPNFAFYVSIARYYYRNGKWTGEWLQINKSNKAIWGRARLDG